MEIGGFITEGAEIVNHDNSLSGNGTVDSPLGVVPGYNETVLYKSTANPATATMPITLAEPISNFERIRIVGRNEGSTSNVIPYKVWEYDTDSLAFSTIMCLDQIMPHDPISNWDNGIYCRVCCVDLSESGKLKPIHTDSYSITKAGAWTRQSTDSWGETRIYKVVGINRKA